MDGADSTTLEYLKMRFLIDLGQLTLKENTTHLMSQKERDLQFKWQVYHLEEFLLELEE